MRPLIEETFSPVNLLLIIRISLNLPLWLVMLNLRVFGFLYPFLGGEGRKFEGTYKECKDVSER